MPEATRDDQSGRKTTDWPVALYGVAVVSLLAAWGWAVLSCSGVSAVLLVLSAVLAATAGLWLGLGRGRTALGLVLFLAAGIWLMVGWLVWLILYVSHCDF